ncbi:MAG: hypothetical protein AAF511_09075 [Pseudomonadota bacterium]
MTEPSFTNVEAVQPFAPLLAAASEFSERVGCPPNTGVAIAVSASEDITAGVSWDVAASVYRIEVSNALLKWIDRSAAAFSRSALAEAYDTTQNAGLKTYVQQSWLLAILSHELAHIGAGHVNYLNARPGSALGVYDEVKVRRMGVGPDRVPLRFFEYEADFGAGLWLLDFAASPPRAVSRWSAGTSRENLIVALAGFALFTFRLEKQVRMGGHASHNCPSPLLRFSILTSSMLSAWEEQNQGEQFAEAIMAPLIEALWSARDHFPEVDFVRDFVDPDWLNDLQDQVDELASETSDFGHFIKPFRLSSFVD